MTIYNPDHLYVHAPTGKFIKVAAIATGRLGFPLNASDVANDYMKRHPGLGVIEVLRQPDDRQGMTDLVLLAMNSDLGKNF